MNSADARRSDPRSVAGKSSREKDRHDYPATIGVLPAFLSRIARKRPDIIIRQLESGQINLGFSDLENIGSLRFFAIASDEYLLPAAKHSPLPASTSLRQR